MKISLQKTVAAVPYSLVLSHQLEILQANDHFNEEIKGQNFLILFSPQNPWTAEQA
jgi:hypothetical protein